MAVSKTFFIILVSLILYRLEEKIFADFLIINSNFSAKTALVLIF